MVIFLILILLLSIEDCTCKLVIQSGCDKFRKPLFSNKHKDISATHGRIVESFNQNLGTTILIEPASKEYNIKEVSLLIYDQKDLKFISNLPKNASNVDSWPNSFGVCTEDDISIGKCETPGGFTIIVNDQIAKDRIINRVFQFEEREIGGFTPVGIEVNNARYCYIIAIDGLKVERKNYRPQNNKPIIQIYFMDPPAPENVMAYVKYYGFMSASIIKFFLSIVIWLKMRSEVDGEFNLYTPHKACLAIIIISFTTSILQMINIKKYVGPMNIYGSDKNSIYYKYSEFFEMAVIISGTVGNILIYLICYQFINLDKFGAKIDFRKNKYGYIFIGVLIWSLMIHPSFVSYRSEVINATLSAIKGKKQTANSLNKKTLKECIEFFNLLNYITIWFILYKTSQDSENKYLSNNISNKEYAQRFKLTRIWLIFSSIVIKIVGFILERFIWKLVWKFIRYIEMYFNEQIPYKQGTTEIIFTKLFLFMLKGLLIALKAVNDFALPILVTITLTIWWRYRSINTTNQTETIRMEDIVN